MHTREETLNRINEIAAFAERIPTASLNLDMWHREQEDQSCGTVCCVMGWLTENRMFGLQWDSKDRLYPELVEDGEHYAGFTVCEKVLLGSHKIDLEAKQISYNLFAAIGDSHYDEKEEIVALIERTGGKFACDQKQVFMKRLSFAIEDINNLYDRVEAESVQVSNTVR
ncbi:hypothetical protein [Methyloversatilis sp.]|uniref:hypothetical protein n=1 Tax=Methyloversatilis sp. TaxID=2569862 RepID=UPI0035B42B9C